MAELKYPIGIQTFSKIIKHGFAYVDKTQYIKPLVSQGQYIFLSRPRRFGKSLLLSTLEAYFEGRRELFKGLAADSMDLDWTPSPVLYFDFNTGKYTDPSGLENRLTRHLENHEKKYGVLPEKNDDVALRFENLISSVYERTGQEVVILIDEYDKPLLAVEENEELFEKHQRILKSFFGNLKSMDRYIRFAMITGVARFSRVSIFSDLNNLKDISMTNDYADICGWTEEELIKYFRSGIEELAKERKEDFDSTLKEVRRYYDGYLFAARGSRLYNPYSVLTAFDDKEIGAHWFVTGTPTFLARWVRNNGMSPWEINGVMASKEDLSSVGFDQLNPVPLMFQTGYLTIDNYDSESQLYTLRLPNREVEIGFFRLLLKVYDPRANQQGSPFDYNLFKNDLTQGKIQDFMLRLQTMLKDLPGKDHKESSYRAITYILAMICGTMAITEHDGYEGRSDLEVFTKRFIYLFEFKYNKSVKEALDQIHDRDYAGKFAMDPRKVFLIGANFSDKKGERGLQYEIQMLR